MWVKMGPALLSFTLVVLRSYNSALLSCSRFASMQYDFHSCTGRFILTTLHSLLYAAFFLFPFHSLLFHIVSCIIFIKYLYFFNDIISTTSFSFH